MPPRVGKCLPGEVLPAPAPPAPLGDDDRVYLLNKPVFQDADGAYLQPRGDVPLSS